MPIKRLQKDAPPQFPCIGKLRKGGTMRKNKDGKDIMGVDLDYFRFVTEDARAASMFEAQYGTTPDTIDVFLPFCTTEENFSAWQEHWLSGGLMHRCDGETCSVWLDRKTGQYRKASDMAPGESPPPCPGGCKETGRLMVIIPALQRFAYVTVETHSIHDIMRIDENLRAVEGLAGTLREIPFLLKRRPVEISTPNPSGKSGRTRRTKSLLSIEVDPVWAASRLVSMRTNAIGVSGIDEAHMLEAFDDDDADELDAIDVEASEHDTAASIGNGDGTDDDPFDDANEPVTKINTSGWNIDKAKAWAIGIGAFADKEEADAAYAEVKATLKKSKPKSTANDMWDAWIDASLRQVQSA